MSRGFSMTELLVALAIFAMACTAIALNAVSIPAVLADAKTAAMAIQTATDRLHSTSTAEEALEDEHIVRRITRVGWFSIRGTAHSTELSTIVASTTGPATCDPFTSGDWQHLKRVSSHKLGSNDLIPAILGTYSISALAISPDTLVVSAASSSIANAPTLFFFSLNGTTPPRLTGAFDNAVSSRIGNSSIGLDGAFAYVGNAFSSASQTTCRDESSCAQVNIYRMHSPIVRISSLLLSTTSLPYAYIADGSGASASAVVYSQQYLYVGLQKTVKGEEFNSVDVHDPAHPRWVGGYAIGRSVTNITVRDGYAYVSTDDPTRELIVIDVHDPSRPLLHSTWNAPGSSTFGYGSASTVYGNSIRFGRTYTASGPEFELLEKSTSSITESDHIDSGTNSDPESVRALLTQDRLTFMLLSHRLDVLDTHVAKHSPLISTYALPLLTRGAALACRNNQLYVAYNANDGQGLIDILQGI